VRIAGLYMCNWKCFQGEHYLRLEAKAYAIVARLATDEQRSNGFGKTSVTEAISFAMFGRHSFRTEDEFLTRGEKSCEVRLEFDDGSVVTRSRQLGKTTVLTFRSDGREARGQEAQAEIERRIGLTEQDFVATCSFEQRQIARFILARPEERMTIVSGWVGLEPLERAEALARTRASDLADESASISSAIEAS
jgi:DNA repair exonuclease SbcCD ATPase subunit